MTYARPSAFALLCGLASSAVGIGAILLFRPLFDLGEPSLAMAILFGVIGLFAGFAGARRKTVVKGKTSPEDLPEQLSLEHYQLIAGASNDAVWMAKVNPDTFERQIIYINEVFEEIWGRDIEALKEEGCIYNPWIHPDDYGWVGEALTSFLKGEAVCDLEFRVSRPDGSVRWVWTKADRIVGKDGRVRFVVGFSRDVTALKAQQEVLASAKQAAEAANASKDRFLAMVSHELRTPLNPILGYAEILSSKTSDPVTRQFLDVIKESAKGMSTLVGDILEYSVIEAGRIEIESNRFRLSALLNLVRLQVQDEAQASGNSLQLELEGLDPVLLSDKLKLRRVVTNLVTNACKFTSEGDIRLKGICQRVANSKADIRIEVSDTGKGISNENLSRIFEPFEQVGSVHRAETRGVGLGLTICRQIVQALGGKIVVDSKVGIGSSFAVELSLPVSETPVPELDITAASDDVKFTRRHRVLLVDDDVPNLQLMSERLKEFGFSTQSCNSGREAIEKAKQSGFDLVLMDLNMPDLSGQETTELLRKSASLNSDIPVIGVSAHVTELMREQCLRSGITDFLEKPHDVQDLRRCLHHWLEPKPQSKATHSVV